jgi:DNA-binding CsgD family transcriptional regulator
MVGLAGAIGSASPPAVQEITGPMAGRIRTFDLTSRDRETLERWIRGRTTPQRLVMRSRVVLLLAEGISGRVAAERLGISRHTVDLWRRRYLQGGCDALIRDRAGRGRKGPGAKL